MEITHEVSQHNRVTNTYELSNGMILTHSFYLSQWAAKDAGANSKAGAIYVEGAKEPTLLDGILKHTHRGDDREMDAAWDAHNKMVVEYQRDEFAKVLEAEDYSELPEMLRDVLEGKLKFSRYAGCSCPCSPGWLGANRSVLGIGGSMRVMNVEYLAEVKRQYEEAAIIRGIRAEAAAAN